MLDHPAGDSASSMSTKGAAIEADYAFKEFCAAIIGPFGWFMRRDYFSS